MEHHLYKWHWSIEALNIQTNTAIYPNPTSDNSTLQITANENTSAILSIYDFLGQKVLSENLTLNSGQNQILLSTSDLSNGAYLVQITLGSLNASTSLMVQK